MSTRAGRAERFCRFFLRERRLTDDPRKKAGGGFVVPGTSDTIRFPGDPTAPGYLIWNCRCTTRAVIAGWQSMSKQGQVIKTGQTYAEWKAGHGESQDILSQTKKGEAIRQSYINEYRGNGNKRVDISEKRGIIDSEKENTKISSTGRVVNPMLKRDYEKMKTALEKRGIEVFAATEGDDLAYLMFIGAEGTYSNGRITHIGEIPSRGTFFEEIIHMSQSQKYGELDSSDTTELIAREIEANRKLLKYQRQYKLDALDVGDLERNLSYWERRFVKLKGVKYDESDYRKPV